MICSSVNLFFTSNLLNPGSDSNPDCYSKLGGRRRRAGITDALHHLQGLQAVVQRRGGVQVVESAALGLAACGCHVAMDARYERIFARASLPSDRLSSFIFHNNDNFIR